MQHLVLFDESNQMAGFGETVMERPEVKAVFLDVTGLRIGWQGYLPLSVAGHKIQVFGVHDQEITCTVGDPTPIDLTR